MTLSKYLQMAAALSAMTLFAVSPVRAADAQAASARDTTALPGKEKLPVVSVVEAKVGEVVDRAIVAGTIVPREETQVAPEIEGLAITEILAEEGDTVAKGQVLARLQRDTIEALLAQNAAQIARAAAQIAQANAQINEVDANLADAKSALERARQLREGGWASTERLEQRETAQATWLAKRRSAEQAKALAEADKVAIQAQRHELELRLARTEIKAPVAGLLSKRTARVGMVASAQAGPLFRIITGGEIELEAEVADVTMPRLTVGLPVQVQPAGFETSLKGKVRLVSPQIDRATRLGTVRISVEPHPGLKIGAFAKGVIELARREGLTLPQSAIAFERDGASIKVVEDGAVKARAVKLGLAGSGQIEIVEGVNAGEKVVARAGAFLRDGDRITVAAD